MGIGTVWIGPRHTTNCCAVSPAEVARGFWFVGSDWKGKPSPVLYAVAIPLSFAIPWIAIAIYALVALLWFIPDRRIERVIPQAQ